MLIADELRRLREAATPGPWEFRNGYDRDGDSCELLMAEVGKAKEDEDAEWAEVLFGSEFGAIQVGANWDLIAYLVNNCAAIEEALRDRDRIDKCADQRIVDGISHFDIDDRTADAMRAANDDTEEGWKMEWRKQFRAAIDEVLADADSAAIDAARKEGE